MFCCQGLHSSHGVDYFGTFALVKKLNIIKVLIVLAAKCMCGIQQFDVKMHFSIVN